MSNTKTSTFRVSTSATAAVLAELSECGHSNDGHGYGDRASSSSSSRSSCSSSTYAAEDSSSSSSSRSDDDESDYNEERLIPQENIRRLPRWNKRAIDVSQFPLPPNCTNMNASRSPSPTSGAACAHTFARAPPSPYVLDYLNNHKQRVSSPVSAAFSPSRPPQIPLPSLPNTPSPVLLLHSLRQREGSGRYASHLQQWHSEAPSPKPEGHEDGQASVGLGLDDLRSAKPGRTRSATARPSDYEGEKLAESIPHSPTLFCYILQKSPPILSYTPHPNTAKQALQPPLPIRNQAPSVQHCSAADPATDQEGTHVRTHSKNSSQTSLDQYNEIVSIALEASIDSSSSTTTSSEYQYDQTSASAWHTCNTRTSVVSYDDEDDEDDMHTRCHESIAPLPHLARKQSIMIFDDCSSSDEEAFDLTLDAHASLNFSQSTVSQHIHYILPSPSDSSPSSAYAWTSRRDSLLTQTSQSSCTTATTNETNQTRSLSLRSPRVASQTTASLEACQDQESAQHGQGFNMSHATMAAVRIQHYSKPKAPRAIAESVAPVQSTLPTPPWQDSLVQISPRRIPASPHTRPPIISQYASTSKSLASDPGTGTTSLRSRLPTMGMGLRRAMDGYRPSLARESSLLAQPAVISTNLSNYKEEQGLPVTSTLSSLNRLRVVRSTPLLRRKTSSQLQQVDLSSGLPVSQSPAQAKHVPSNLGRKGSFLPVALSRAAS